MNHLKTGTAFFRQGSYKNNKYNGKELQETGMYSYGWREYMPDIARWNGIDQLTESYLSTSTYAYVANNPVSYADVDGRWFNEDGTIDTSGYASSFINTRSYMQQSFGIKFGDYGGDSQSLFDKIFSLGGDWHNTGNGFNSSENISLGYDGSYGSLNIDYAEGGIGERIYDIPGLTINGSKLKYAFTGDYFFGSDKLSIFNHLNKYIGAMAITAQWDGDRGFKGNWANSDNFWAKLSYGMANNFYLGLQMVDTFNWLGAKRMSNYTGREAFSNLDGSSQFDSGNRLMAFATTFNPFGPKLSVNVPATFGAIGESVLPQAAFRMTDDLAPLSASQFSMLFKGTAISRATPATRGLFNRYLNKGLNGVNSVGLYRTVSPAAAKAILPHNDHNNR